MPSLPTIAPEVERAASQAPHQGVFGPHSAHPHRETATVYAMRLGDDALAFHCDVNEYANCLLVEQPNGDFGQTIARQFLFSNWHLLMLEKLTASTDATLAAIAAKGIKEVAYHAELAADWVVRLGDGTVESAAKWASGLHRIWRFVDELFVAENAVRRSRRGLRSTWRRSGPRGIRASWWCWPMRTWRCPRHVARWWAGGRDGTPSILDICSPRCSICRVATQARFGDQWSSRRPIRLARHPCHRAVDRRGARACGLGLDVRTEFAPVWTTNWITPDGPR